MGGWVVVVGSINVDLTVRVAKLPRPGETVVNGILTRCGGRQECQPGMCRGPVRSHDPIRRRGRR